jgi:hypothetical protein
MGLYYIRVTRLHMRHDFASCKYIKLNKKIIQVTSVGVLYNRINLKFVNYEAYVAMEGGGLNGIGKML